MIASLRGLLVLGAIALVLLVAVIADRGSQAPVDHALVHLELANVQRLAWPDLVATRAGTTWKAGDVTLDSAAIRDVLRTLEAARWHRRGGSPGQVHTTLEIDRTKIGIADPLSGTDQTWVVVDGTPFLVDGWVARALAPGALALHVRHPFAAASRSGLLNVAGTPFSGHPRRLVTARDLIADVAAVAALERVLEDVEVVALGGSATTDASTTQTVWLDDSVSRIGGTCAAAPDLVAVAGTYGNECIARDTVARISDAVRTANTVERRPVWFEPVAATLADGEKVDLRSAQAQALAHALTTPAGEVGAPGALPELTHVSVTGGRSEHADLRVRPHDLVERVADGAVLHIAHADWLALQAPASAYVDPTRWSEDPTAVEAIGVNGVTYRRGAVLGEWAPSAPLDAATLNALAIGLATVRARDAVPAPTAHIFTVTLAPPVGAQVTHTLELGTACAGRIDGKAVTFEQPTCAALGRTIR